MQSRQPGRAGRAAAPATASSPSTARRCGTSTTSCGWSGANPSREIALTVGRGGETLDRAGDAARRGRPGQARHPAARTRRCSSGSVPSPRSAEAVRECGRMTRETFAVLGRMLTRPRLDEADVGPDRHRPLLRRGGAHGRRAVHLAARRHLAAARHLQPAADPGARRRPPGDHRGRGGAPPGPLVRTKERILNVGFWLIIA